MTAISTESLTNGFYFDLGVLTLAAIIVGTHSGWRWLTYGRHERRHSRMVEQYLAAVEERDRQLLAEAQRPSFPQGTHEGDWDWPRRPERDRLLRSGQ
jgi:hypothetical protein